MTRTREQLSEIARSSTHNRLVNELAAQCLAMIDVVEAAMVHVLRDNSDTRIALMDALDAKGATDE